MEHPDKPKLLKNKPVFQAGYWVAVVIKDKVLSSDCYVGEIQAVDEHGIRITLVDWFIGFASGNDLFISWDQIAVALTATDQHNLGMFLNYAGTFQTQTNHRSGNQEWKERYQHAQEKKMHKTDIKIKTDEEL